MEKLGRSLSLWPTGRDGDRDAGVVTFKAVSKRLFAIRL
jgi:hypothetical protein